MDGKTKISEITITYTMVYRVKIGFVPLHRPFFDENWASELRKRTINELSKLDMIQLVYPDETITHRGLVSRESDAEGEYTSSSI